MPWLIQTTELKKKTQQELSYSCFTFGYKYHSVKNVALYVIDWILFLVNVYINQLYDFKWRNLSHMF